MPCGCFALGSISDENWQLNYTAAKIGPVGEGSQVNTRNVAGVNPRPFSLISIFGQLVTIQIKTDGGGFSIGLVSELHNFINATPSITALITADTVINDSVVSAVDGGVTGPPFGGYCSNCGDVAYSVKQPFLGIISFPIKRCLRPGCCSGVELIHCIQPSKNGKLYVPVKGPLMDRRRC